MTSYRCSECGAVDRDRTNNSPMALICWQPRCRAGAAKEDWQNRRGMFPVKDGYYPWGELAPTGTSAEISQ